MKRFYLLLIIFSLFTSIAIAQSDKAADRIKEIMSLHKGLGMSVAVIKDNKLVYVQSFGQKNIADNTMLSNTDVFRIASISKSFAATAIMQLVEQKKLSLDDDFGKLVGFKVRNPAFPEHVITLRMVMSHTSSINDSQGYFNFDSINPEKSANFAKNYNNYAPGSDYQYCNLNYNMIGAVIEKISGKRYDQYIQDHILGPLNLYGGYDVDLMDRNKFATLYTWNKQTNAYTEGNAYGSRAADIAKYQLGVSTPILSPTGGMKISAKDLALYMQMHMNMGKGNGKKIISKKSAIQMQTPLSSKENYGLALRAERDVIDGVRMVGHTGSAYGLYSSMFFDPIKKYGFVVLTNGSDGSSKNGYIEITHKTIQALNEVFILNK